MPGQAPFTPSQNPNSPAALCQAWGSHLTSHPSLEEPSLLAQPILLEPAGSPWPPHLVNPARGPLFPGAKAHFPGGSSQASFPFFLQPGRGWGSRAARCGLRGWEGDQADGEGSAGVRNQQ